MNKLFALLCGLLLLISPLTANQSFEDYLEQYYRTWDADPPEIQQAINGSPLAKELGAVFIPSMAISTTEPILQIRQIRSSDTDSADFLARVIIDQAFPGQQYILSPGQYRIETFTGDIFVKQTFAIYPEERAILQPHYGGITFIVQNQNREYLKDNFDVYDITSRSIRKVLTFSSDDLEKVDKARTYYLPPGLYKIVKAGANIAVDIDFATFLLLPGHYIPFTIVIDEETRHFMGCGNSNREAQQRKIQNWKLIGAWHGNFNLSHANDVTADIFSTNYLFSSQLEFQARYDNPHYYFNTRNIIEEGWNKQNDLEFRSIIDNMETKNILILKLYKILGLYGRINLNSRFFPTWRYFSNAQNANFYNRDNKLVKTKTNVDRVRLAPSMFPLAMKQGLGLNFTFSPSYRISVFLRGGLGFRQTFNHDVYTLQNDTTFINLDHSFLKGIESSIYAQFYLSSQIYIISELDILSPFQSSDDFVYEFENICNLRLIKNLSLDYTIRIKQNKNISRIVQKEHIIMLRYSHYFF